MFQAVRPTAEQVKQLRLTVQAHYNLRPGQAREKCADAVYNTPRIWRYWETGGRVMPAATWALVQLRTNAHPHWRLVSRVT
jgi:hypothetical protein